MSIENFADWFALALKGRVPEGWQWRQSEAVDGGFVLTGYVVNGVFTRGKNKGKPKPNLATKSVHVVTDAQIADAKARWEIETGKCPRCYGTGQVMVSWSKDEGRKTRPCKRCGGVGAIRAESNAAIGGAP